MSKSLNRVEILGGIAVGYLLFASESIEHLLCVCLFYSVIVLLSELSELLDSEVSLVLLVIPGEISLLLAHFVVGLDCCFYLSLLFGLVLLFLYRGRGLVFTFNCFGLLLLNSVRSRVFGLLCGLLLLPLTRISRPLLLSARLFCWFLLLVCLCLLPSLVLLRFLRFLTKFILLFSLLLRLTHIHSLPILRALIRLILGRYLLSLLALFDI